MWREEALRCGLLTCVCASGGFNVRPRHFECDITIRSAQHEKVLREEYVEARAVMEQFPLFKEDAASV